MDPLGRVDVSEAGEPLGFGPEGGLWGGNAVNQGYQVTQSEGVEGQQRGRMRH